MAATYQQRAVLDGLVAALLNDRAATPPDVNADQRRAMTTVRPAASTHRHHTGSYAWASSATAWLSPRPVLVFLADLTVELRAWPQQTWTTVGVNPEAALLAVVDRWRAGRVKGLELGGVSAEEARALGRPPMGYVRAQLRDRLAREISRQYLRWLHPTSRRRSDETFL